MLSRRLSASPLASASPSSSSPHSSSRASSYRLIGRSTDEHHLETQTRLDAIPTVDVISPVITGASSEIALPGNTQAFDDTPIYARTSGYLKQWFVDIGAHVTKGELMATIETPELDEQLQVAQADLKSAQADLNLANTTSDRYQNLLKLNSVSQQETDVAVSGAAARRAAVEAARSQRPPPQPAAILREGLRSLRRHRHPAQHRHRRPHQCRLRHRQQHRQGALPHRLRQRVARLRRRPRGLRSRHS